MTDREKKQTSDRGRKVRTALAVVLALLVLLLITTSYFLVQVLTPVGSKAAKARTPEGMQWIRTIYGYGTKADAQLLGPNDTAVSPSGTIWVSDSQRARLIGFNPDGSYRTMIHQGPRNSSPAAIDWPAGIDVDENGLVYVCDFGKDRVMVFSEDNKLLRQWDVPAPVEVAVNADRVAVSTVNGVALFTKQGELITLIGERGDRKEEFDNPRGLVFGPDGTLYVCDTLNNRTKALDKDGKTLWVRKYGPAKNSEEAEASREGSATPPLQMPAGITMDAAGRLVAVDPFELVIAVLDPKDGDVVAKYGDMGNLDGQFLYPTGISYDADRDWFAVADTSNDRVQIVRIKGSGGGILAALRRAAVGPVWVCCIPLFLLLIAVILLVTRRRAEEKRRVAPGFEEISEE